MDKNNTNDDLFEAILRQAVIKNHEDEMNSLYSELADSEKYVFSERHNRRMKNCFPLIEENKFSAVFLSTPKSLY